MSLTDEDKLWISAQLDTTLEGLETKLLTAFANWARPNDQKLRSHREAIRALDPEIEAIAARVMKLEQDLDRPN